MRSWLLDLKAIFGLATISFSDLASLSNKVLDISSVRTKTQILNASLEKSRFQHGEQADPSRLLPENFFPHLVREYRHTYEVAQAAKSGRTNVSLWTRIGAAIEIQRDIRREVKRQKANDSVPR